MFGWRLLGGLGLSVPFVFMLWLEDQANGGHPGIWLVPVAILIAVAATAELVGLFIGQVPELGYGPACVGALAMTTAMSVPVVLSKTRQGPFELWGWLVLGICLAMAILLLAELLRFSDGRALAERVGLAFWSIVAVAVPFSCLLYLRVQEPNRLGLMLIVSTIFVVKCSDAGAYFVGTAIGKHRLAPRLSPGKTWEGAIGGLIAAVASAWALHTYVVPQLAESAAVPPLSSLMLYGAALHVAGVLGDLAESMFKRSAGKKDSASWLPGLGGLLDVIDSVLWAAPVAYLFWASGLFHT